MEDLHGILPLEYISFIGVPMRATKEGPAVDLPAGTLERMAARAVIQYRVPIHGREVKFLRKALGLSLERFANKIGLTSGAVFKWEKESEARLHPTNEIAVRVFFAECLEVEIPGKFSELVGRDRVSRLKLQAS
jgi:DNA-binding transcriptional regulator YiaG